MAKSSSGESKAPLVIALVFFVLACIGLGVFAYTTSEDLAVANESTKKANDEATAAKKVATAAREEALIYKGALGILSDADKSALGGLQDRNAAQNVHRAMTEAINQNANKTIGDFATQRLAGNFNATVADVFVWPWPEGTNPVMPPERSLIDATVKAIGEREVSDRTAKEAAKANAAATAEFVKLSTQRDADAKKFKDDTREIPNKLAAETAKIQAAYEARAKEFVQVLADGRTKIELTSEELAKRDLDIKRKAERIAIQERRIEELLEKQTDLIDPFKFDKPQGRILRRYSDSLVDIDIGSSDKLRPGLAFSIFPSDTLIRGMEPRMRAFRDQDNKTYFKPVPKGKVEVIDVLGPNISVCRIVDEDNAVRDRIIPGDLLYNALWRKGTSEHVALFGIFDLDGDGRDDMQALIVALRRVGVIVDAYFDLSKNEWVGEITSQTNFGVEGYYPTVNAADGNRDEKIKILGGISKARKDVKEKGILTLRPRDIFPRIGLNARLDVNEDAINQAATGFTRAQPPATPKAEGAPAPKPGEEKPEEKKN